jgi:S-adenosylmethionine-diacylglycerol 3-amino-3-carboxypropyl transferase
MRPKFAVVREDPELESTLVDHTGAIALLTVASGGCTPLTLATRHPSLAVTAFDVSEAQLRHVERKVEALLAGRLEALGLGSADPRGLHQLGHFEGLFRLLSQGVRDLIGVDPARLVYPTDPEALAAALTSPYWPALYATLLADPLLHAMFGPAATQHAVPGSYPSYFQRAFERGLSGCAPNYFVRHVFAQDYAPGDAPAYLLSPPVEVPLTLLQGTLTDVPSLERFGVISLSNVFDWSDDALVAVWADHLREHARPGAHVLVRKLNNDRPLAFGPGFVRDTALGARLLAADRSLFYRQIEVWVRT